MSCGIQAAVKLREQPRLSYRGLKSCPPHACVSRLGLQGQNAVVNDEIIRAKTLIAELKLNNETAHQLTHSIGNLLTVQRLLLEQIHRTHRTLQVQSSVAHKSNNAVFAIYVTEEEPPKPPPDEDESKPPVKEPPTEEPPVKEPPPNNS